jgi:outer membrane protein assembly factor BamB
MKLRAVVLTLGLGLMTGLSGCSTVSGWFGSSPASEAAKPAELVDFKPLVVFSEAWKAGVGDGGGQLFHPQEEGDSLFAAGLTRVVRLNLNSGKSEWQVDVPARLSAGVGLGEGLAVVGGGKGEVHALDAENGEIRWTAYLSSEVSSGLLVVPGMVVVRTGDGRVQGLALEDGSRKWLYSRNLPALSLRGSGGMAARDGVVYAGFPGGKLVALNAGNGAQLWESTVALPRGATELERVADVIGNPVVDSRQVCAVAYQGRVACFDRRNGSPLWTRDTSSNSGLAMDSRYVFVTDDKDAVTAYDKDGGRAVWRQDKLANRKLSAPLALGDLVVVGDGEGYVHVLSAEDGSFAARAKVDSSVLVAPVDIGPGIVVQTRSGSLVAFKLQ